MVVREREEGQWREKKLKALGNKAEMAPHGAAGNADWWGGHALAQRERQTLRLIDRCECRLRRPSYAYMPSRGGAMLIPSSVIVVVFSILNGDFARWVAVRCLGGVG